MVARVGLLSADSFVNCKFGSQGTEEGVRPFYAPQWVGAVQCVGGGLAFNIFGPYPHCASGKNWMRFLKLQFLSALHLLRHCECRSQILGRQPFQT